MQAFYTVVIIVNSMKNFGVSNKHFLSGRKKFSALSRVDLPIPMVSIMKLTKLKVIKIKLGKRSDRETKAVGRRVGPIFH